MNKDTSKKQKEKRYQTNKCMQKTNTNTIRGNNRYRVIFIGFSLTTVLVAVACFYIALCVFLYIVKHRE